MNLELQYLLSYLEEEFSRFPGVRVRLSPASGVKRSIDLPQDYDPESSDLHRKRGVIVYTKRQEHYFPVEWVIHKNYDQLRLAASELRDKIERE